MPGSARQRGSSSPCHVIEKKTSVSGLARIHIILLLLCAALLTAVLVPAYRAYRYHGQWLACAASLRVVNGAFIVDLLDQGEAVSIDEAADELVAILPGRDGYCPAGGTVYYQKQEDGEWQAFCGMHDSDHMKRTRFNASYVLNRVREEVDKEQSRGNAYPEEVTVVLNGFGIVCRLVTEETGIRRGTNTTKGYKGTVVFYGIAGNGTFGADNGTNGAAKGEICYFCFADEEYNAVWRRDDGWSGKSYGDTY